MIIVEFNSVLKLNFQNTHSNTVGPYLLNIMARRLLRRIETKLEHFEHYRVLGHHWNIGSRTNILLYRSLHVQKRGQGWIFINSTVKL